VQVALHDGSNFLVKVADPKNPTEVTYETFDVLKVSLADKQVAGVLKTKVGNIAVITGGKNIGKMGKIVEIEKTEAKKRRQALAVIENANGAKYQTILDFVFSLGEKEPLITEATPVV
jgi:small subunit ribosomal protein S4e